MLAAALVLVLLAGREAAAAAPTDQLRESVDRVVKVLEDPDLRNAAKTRERRAALRRIANEVFDFKEMAKRTLALHWHARTPAEREEFVELFANLLERSYISKIELYRGEKVAYLGDRLEGGLATVRTKLLAKDADVPVDYRMHRRGEHWLVYDVVIEGISLVANYRAQFNKIIQTASYGALVARLKAKEPAAPQGPTGNGAALQEKGT